MRRAPASSTAANGGRLAAGGRRSVEVLAEGAQAEEPRDAYDIVIREDKVEAYQAYLALYSASRWRRWCATCSIGGG